MKIDVTSAADGLPVIRNLFSLYAHDMSPFASLDVDETGTFAIPASLATYWDGPDASRRYPFLVRADGKLAGFALVRQVAGEPLTYDMGEFFVLRRYRRCGVGRVVASRLFDRFAGRWEVRQLPSNVVAQKFWREIIADYTKGAFAETQEFFATMGREFVVQRFRTDR
jgi:predicted acetyltransferase